MPNLLKQLELEELSLVDRPANAQAMVSLFKRDNQEGSQMKEAQKQEEAVVEEIVEEIVEEVSEVDTLKAENENLRKALIENGFVIKAESIEKKEEVELVEFDGEQVNKADIPAPVLKALEAAEVEKKEAAIAKKAEELLPNFDHEVAKSLVSVDLDEKVMEALKAADAAFAAAMVEKGESDAEGDLSDPQTKLDKMVEAVQLEKGLTKEQAFAEVARTKDGAGLINKIYKKED